MLKNRVRGEECCDFLFSAQCIADEDFPTFLNRRKRIGNKAKMPWEYHTAHLYKTMKETIVDAFGKNGKEAVKRALDAYEKEYGRAAKDLVLAYADLDFDVMPDYPGIDG